MTAALVTLAQAKDHLRVVSSVEDADIQLKLNAATQMAVEYLDRDVFATAKDLADAQASGQLLKPDPLIVTDMVRAGILLVLGDLYANREETVTGTIATQLPTGARACLRSLRRVGC